MEMQYLVIQDNEVIGRFESNFEAFSFAEKEAKRLRFAGFNCLSQTVKVIELKNV